MQVGGGSGKVGDGTTVWGYFYTAGEYVYWGTGKGYPAPPYASGDVKLEFYALPQMGSPF